MLRLEPTVIELTTNDLKRFRQQEVEDPPVVNLLKTILRAEAVEFEPSQDIILDMVQAQPPHLDTLPAPSPHIDRYPVLLPPNRRRNTTITGIRPRITQRQFSSPADSRLIANLRRVSIEQLSSRLRERSMSYSSHHDAELDVLRFEHSPLDQLMLNLQIVSETVDPNRAQSPESQASSDSGLVHAGSVYENNPPTAMTVSRVPSNQVAVVYKHNTRGRSLELHSNPTSEHMSTPRLPHVVPVPKTAITTAKRRVQVYHDSPFSYEEYHTPTSRARRHRRAQVVSGPATVQSHSGGSSAQVYRHTYPLAAYSWQEDVLLSDSRRYRNAPATTPPGHENDDDAQIQQAVNELEHSYHAEYEMDNTPPLRGRYDEYL